MHPVNTFYTKSPFGRSSDCQKSVEKMNKD